MWRIIALPLFFVLLYSLPADACTTVAVTDSSGRIEYVAKSYDWGTQAATVVSNMAGITKRSLVFPTDDATVPTTAVSWTSRIPSITFNQYGREIATAGMNQYGLVVETMEMDPGSKYVSGTIYKPAGATEVINANQWVQYILDTFTSVDDFLAPGNYPPAFAIMPDTVPVHFMICDSSKCVVVEIIDNNLVTTQGDDLGVQLQDGTFIPVKALTNDYYDCSVHGLNGDTTLSLEDYIGYGGMRAVPFGPRYCVFPLEDICPPGTECPALNIKGCDQACRTDPHGAWYYSNSIERFVRAAVGSNELSGNNATVDDMFGLLDNVFSTDRTTGASMWQIVYEPQKLMIHWRTIADGCDLEHGFTGAYRSIGFGDFDFGDGKCRIPDNSQVVNIDEAAPCSNPDESQICFSPLRTCNPIPSLPSCTGSECTISAYNPQDNINLVEFSARHSEVNTKGFVSGVKKQLPNLTDADAKTIMYYIWGNYPDVYTKCNGQVATEDVVNWFLAQVENPYVTPYVKSEMEAEKLDYDKKASWGPFSYEVKGGFSGQGDTALSTLLVTNDGKPTDKLTVGGSIPKLTTTGSVTLTADIPCVPDVWNSCPQSVKGTVTVSFPVKQFDVDSHGAKVSDDVGAMLCFVDKTVQVEHVSYSLGDISCSVSIDLGPLRVLGVSADFLCTDVYSSTGSLIESAVNGALKNGLWNKVVVGNIPQCDSTAVSLSPPPVLNADWGGLEGQYVTARAGHTYSLQGIVNADGDSFDHEFATFSEKVPGSADLLRIDTVRIRSKNGDNAVETLWTPGSTGDYDLYLDVFPWDWQPAEVAPAALRVHVLPAGGPTSWLGLTNEGLSSRLKEVK